MIKIPKAEKILLDLGITRPGEIDLEVIAWEYNAIIKERKLDGCQARIIGKDDHAIISVDKDIHVTAQRFSIAHELGHWKNDRGLSFFCSTDNLSRFENSNYAEKMANQFAADLLIPDFMIRRAYRGIKNLNWNNIKELAGIFKTSLTATAYKLVSSNEYPVILAYYENNCRKWFKASSQVPSHFFPLQYINPPVSLHSDDIYQVSIDSWFELYRDYDFEISEQTKQYNNNVMVLLTIDNEELLQLN